jgi:hypothetical protein
MQFTHPFGALVCFGMTIADMLNVNSSQLREALEAHTLPSCIDDYSPPKSRGDKADRLLLRFGDLEVPDLDPDIYIHGEIHPIFSKRNWITTMDMDIYERMEPGLLLASHFLERSAFLGWWEHVMQGDVMYGAADNRRVLQKGTPGTECERLEATVIAFEDLRTSSSSRGSMFQWIVRRLGISFRSLNDFYI